MRSLTLWTTLLVSGLAMAQPEVAFDRFATGFTLPLHVTHASDGSGRLFVVEQGGKIHILDPDGVVRDTDFLDLGSAGLNKINRSGNERGLLGLAFHPDYAANGRFFVNYTRRSDGGTIVEEYTVSADPGVANTEGKVILGPIRQPQSNHNGGHIAFGPDGYLYIAMGDGGAGGDEGSGHTPGIGNGQDITDNLLGTILRIDIDTSDPGMEYAIPPDNPFVGVEGDDEIYAYGLRNPWRFSFDRLTGRLFCGDVGQNRLEEIDIIESGGNYGWRVAEGTECFDPRPGCDMTGLVPPIHDYPRTDGRSVTGGYVYRGRDYPALTGLYIFGDFVTGRVWALEETDSGAWARHDLGTVSTIASFGEDQAGEHYVCSFDGSIYRIRSLTPVSGWGSYGG